MLYILSLFWKKIKSFSKLIYKFIKFRVKKVKHHVYISLIEYKKNFNLYKLLIGSIILRLFLLLIYWFLLKLVDNTTATIIVSSLVPCLIVSSFFYCKSKINFLVSLSLNLLILSIFWFMVSDMIINYTWYLEFFLKLYPSTFILNFNFEEVIRLEGREMTSNSIDKLPGDTSTSRSTSTSTATSTSTSLSTSQGDYWTKLLSKYSLVKYFKNNEKTIIFHNKNLQSSSQFSKYGIDYSNKLVQSAPDKDLIKKSIIWNYKMDVCNGNLEWANYVKDAASAKAYMSQTESNMKESFLFSKTLKSANNYYTSINKGIKPSLEDKTNFMKLQQRQLSYIFGDLKESSIKGFFRDITLPSTLPSCVSHLVYHDYLESQFLLNLNKSLCYRINVLNINLDTVDKQTFYDIVRVNQEDHLDKYKQHWAYSRNLERKVLHTYEKQVIYSLFSKHCYYIFKAASLLEKQSQIVKFDSNKFKLVISEEKSKQNLLECKNTFTIGLELAKSFQNEKKGNLMQELYLKLLNLKS